MTDSNESNKKETLKISSPSRLQLTKTVESGKVKQNFTHGRSKTVTVEVRKTRTFTAGSGGAMVEIKRGEAGRQNLDEGGRTLTAEERELRMKVLKSAEEASRIASEKREAASAAAAAAAEAAQAEEAALPAEEETYEAPVEAAPQEEKAAPAPRPRNDGIILSPLLANRKLGLGPRGKPATAAPAEPPQPGDERFERASKDAKVEKEAKGGKTLKLARGEERRTGGKVSLNQAMGDYEGRVRSLASMRRQREKVLKKAQGDTGAQEKIVREVVIPEAITVQELANRMAVRAVDVIKTLMKLGMMVTVTQTIDADTAELVVGEFGHKFKRVAESDIENVLKDDEAEDEALLESRPPVVTIMGHVDHGKTSLLDALRSTDVAAKEAGGITQHIGAYQVELDAGKVTFLDTPGHEAFTAMRARGAKVTDIVVLVVAADDGIMEQTKEAINQAKAAGVPIIVAVNKIDKPGADASRVKAELMQYELVPEEFGGDVIVVEVSAKQRLNLDKLIEAILLQAEVLELKANPNRPAKGAVVESRLDQGRGVVATLLVQKGTLKVGDIVVAGASYGRVRTLTDDKGRSIKEAGPGMPIEIQGLSLAPDAGDVFSAVENEKTARDIAEYRERMIREQQTRNLNARTAETMFGTGPNKELALIIKGDVQGSVEAIAGSVTKYASDEVAVKILHTGVGAISESDVTLAKATGALIIGFNVRAQPKAKEMAAREKSDLRYYSVIYDVVDDVKALIGGLLSPIAKENFLGYAEIRQVFNVTKAGKVAGCYVTEGMIKRGAKVRLLRDNVVIHEGTLKTLKRFKDEVKEVKSGFECGMAFENYDDIREGDMIEAFEIEQVARTV